jgi:hypothetical protein
LHPKGVEIVTVCLEVTGASDARRYVDAAQPQHPSLIDVAHKMDSEFGVVNIPNVLWIDEQGVIVRPAEPAWPGAGSMPRIDFAEDVRSRMRQGSMAGRIAVDRDRSTNALRDWAERGAASEFALSPEQVVARSQPRPRAVSDAAAHFELAQHLWQAGNRDRALAQFREAHRLQPDNWTYKRQAWSLVGAESAPGEWGRFVQSPLLGDEDSWPFDSDFWSDVEQLGPGEYYPNALDGP